MCAHRSFFFQAEDGIRDATVTGVQTCALPISARIFTKKPRCKPGEAQLSWNITGPPGRNGVNGGSGKEGPAGKEGGSGRSEERSVGKEWRGRGSPER